MQAQNKTKAFLRMPRAIRAALFYFIQWTWGLPQNLAGLLLFAVLGKQRRYRYHGATVTLFGKGAPIMPQSGAVSLGTFIFIPLAWGEEYCRTTAVHEYGHTVQSMVLGPFYLPAIGLPSIVWASRWGRSQSIPASQAVRSVGDAKLPRSVKRRLKLRGVRYTSRYPENWANRLGEYATGEEPSRH